MLSTAAWPRQPRKEDRSAGDTRDLQLAQGLEEVLRRNGGGVVPRLQRVHSLSKTATAMPPFLARVTDFLHAAVGRTVTLAKCAR